MIGLERSGDVIELNVIGDQQWGVGGLSRSEVVGGSVSVADSRLVSGVSEAKVQITQRSQVMEVDLWKDL